MTSQLQQLTLCLLTVATPISNKDAATWIKEKWPGSETSSVREDPWMNQRMTLSRNAKGSSTVSKLVSTVPMVSTTSLQVTCCLMAGPMMKSQTPLSLEKPKTFWSVEEGFLVRNHVIARDSSWRPTADAIKDVPIKLGKLQALKITMREGASTMMVDSVAAAERKISKDGFFGKRCFHSPKKLPKAQDAIHKSQEEDQQVHFRLHGKLTL